MIRKFFLLLLPIFACADLPPEPTKADEITLEWLTLQNGAQYALIFRKLFELTRVKTALEFGVGFSTKYLLDRCNKVISVDVITHGYGSETMKKFLRLYADYSNWIPIAYFSGYMGCDYSWAPFKHLGSEHVYKATAYQHGHHKDYGLIDPFYRIELDAFLASLFKYNKIDMVFLGHASYLRGDLVQLLFDKVPLIIAHDSDGRERGELDDLFQLVRVVTPENYEEIFFPVAGGTTVWIQKKERFTPLIEAMKKYADTI